MADLVRNRRGDGPASGAGVFKVERPCPLGGAGVDSTFARDEAAFFLGLVFLDTCADVVPVALTERVFFKVVVRVVRLTSTGISGGSVLELRQK